jgi:hypothetical protein
MTTPTLTCEHCESEIDVAKDPRAVVYDPSGATDIYCADCRERDFFRWLEDLPVSMGEKLREAYMINKRGWRA